MDTLDTGELIIHAGNAAAFISPRDPNAQGTHGLIPRNMQTHPRGCYAGIAAVDIPLIDQSEWAGRLADMVASKSQLSDIRMTGGPGGGMIPSRDQNGKGFCWAHSGVSAHLIARAVMNEPYADLSAYAIACQIKNFADEGGWGAQGVDWQIQNGVPTSATWPQQSMARGNVSDAMKADAAKHKTVAQWADMGQQEYDRDLSFAQYATLFLSRCPAVTDFNWWSHSVCGIDLVNGATQFGKCRAASGKVLTLGEHDAIWAVNHPVTGGFGIRIWNSWGDSWSQQGTGVLTGNQAIPDGGVGVRLVMPS